MTDKEFDKDLSKKERIILDFLKSRTVVKWRTVYNMWHDSNCMREREMRELVKGLVKKGYLSRKLNNNNVYTYKLKGLRSKKGE